MRSIEYSLQIKMKGVDIEQPDEVTFYRSLYPMIAQHVEENFPGQGDRAEIHLRKEPRNGAGWVVVTAILKDKEEEDGEEQRLQ